MVCCRDLATLAKFLVNSFPENVTTYFNYHHCFPEDYLMQQQQVFSLRSLAFSQYMIAVLRQNFANLLTSHTYTLLPDNIKISQSTAADFFARALLSIRLPHKVVKYNLLQPASGADKQRCKKLHTATEGLHKGNNVDALRIRGDYETDEFVH
jgi:hypothetical protein